MKKIIKKEVWTIGHSTRSQPEFLSMLHSFEIKSLVDVRHYPGSKKFPHFNKENMQLWIQQANIGYFHLPGLGGRRKPLPGSVNTAWRHSAFRGYADHMQTAEFKNAFEQLEGIAMNQRTAYMCSEAVWWRCHRGLISDLFKWKGWEVLNIMDVDKATVHPFTSAARIENDKLVYTEPGISS